MPTCGASGTATSMSATARPNGRPRLGVREPLRRRRHIAAEELHLPARPHQPRSPKITLTSPSLYANLWSPELSRDAYPTLDSFLEDVVDDHARRGRASSRGWAATYLQLDAPHYPLLIDPAHARVLRVAGLVGSSAGSTAASSSTTP